MDGECNMCRARIEVGDPVIEAAANPPEYIEREPAEPEVLKQPPRVSAPKPPPEEPNLTEEAKRELARRMLARKRFLPFVQRFNPDYMPGWVHMDIAQRLEKFMRDVEERKSPRLMIWMPPRHGKSELTTRNFPPWVLGHHPNWEFIQCSYSGALANRFSRASRSLMRDPNYGILFPDTKLDPDAQGAEEWRTTAGGGLLAAGVGGPVTGSGAHILLIDDPVKNREEAESPGQRKLINEDWYGPTAYTRLAPGGGVLIIQTRWHDDDLSGFLLRQAEEGEGDEFEVVNYPAIAMEDEPYRKKGEALHPDRYDEDALASIRKVMSDRDWSALYQQQPVPDEGAYFTRDMFHFYMEDELPPDDHLSFYDAWDLAIGQKEYNDWSVGMTAALDQKEDLWLIDRDRGKYDAMDLVERIINLHLEHDSQITGIERGQIELTIGPFLERRITERAAYNFYNHPLKTGRRDKMARARTLQGMARAGKIHLPHPSWCPWVDELLFEMLRFPAGQHDDQVDAFAWIALMIQEMSPAVLPRPKKKKSWKDNLDKFVTSGSTRKSYMSA